MKKEHLDRLIQIIREDLRGGDFVQESPHIQVGKQSVDLEIEKDKLKALKNIVRAMIGRQIKDSSGNVMKLKTKKERDEFIEQIVNRIEVLSIVK